MGILIQFGQIQVATTEHKQVDARRAKKEMFQAAKRAKVELVQVERALAKLRLAANLLDEVGRAIAFQEGEKIVESLMDISIKATTLEIDLAASIRRQQAKNWNFGGC